MCQQQDQDAEPPADLSTARMCVYLFLVALVMASVGFWAVSHA